MLLQRELVLAKPGLKLSDVDAHGPKPVSVPALAQIPVPACSHDPKPLISTELGRLQHSFQYVLQRDLELEPLELPNRFGYFEVLYHSIAKAAMPRSAVLQINEYRKMYE